MYAGCASGPLRLHVPPSRGRRNYIPPSSPPPEWIILGLLRMTHRPVSFPVLCGASLMVAGFATAAPAHAAAPGGATAAGLTTPQDVTAPDLVTRWRKA